MEPLRASDLHVAAGSPPLVRVHGELTVARGAAGADAGRHPAAPLPDPLDRAAEAARGRPADRPLVRDLRRRPLPRQRLLPAERRRRRVPPDPLQDPHARGARAAGRACTSWPSARAASCSSPGPTGSGKSTTLAAMIDEINRNRAGHILTIEDPIEFLHRHRRCLVNQREIGSDARGFAEALRAALRQDPDVILLGEMRDLETISTALTAAETGHLVFATLHTRGAAGTIDRIIDVFPAEQQGQVRAQLAVQPRRRRHPDAASDGGRAGPRRGARDPDPRLRRPEPDPPAQARADLLRDADRDRARHADDGAVALRARPARHDHDRGRARGVELPGPAARHCSSAPAPRRANGGSVVHRLRPTIGRELRWQRRDLDLEEGDQLPPEAEAGAPTPRTRGCAGSEGRPPQPEAA